MIGKLICWFKGKHVRGKPVRCDYPPDHPEHRKIFACPRCGHQTRYKKGRDKNIVEQPLDDDPDYKRQDEEARRSVIQTRHEREH